MSSEHFIRADDIHLNVPIHVGNRSSIRSVSVLKDLYLGGRQRELRSLIRGMTFEFHEGERVGLIGENGSGKTTLLRLLAGVLQPSAGRLEIDGSTQALLNMSMGLEQRATGLENVYLLGYCAGLTTEQIDGSIPGILEFAELKNAIHDPVRTYSAGMQLRLAFAVATSVKPEILLLDEWISTGDRFFIERSRERLMGHIDASRMLVFASHNPAVLGEVCTRGLVLKGGKVIYDGPIDEALEFYGSDGYQES